MIAHMKPLGSLLCGTLLACAPMLALTQPKEGLASDQEIAKVQLQAMANQHVDNARTAVALLEKDTLMAEARELVNGLQQRDPAWQILHRLQVVLDREQARIQTRLLAVA